MNDMIHHPKHYVSQSATLEPIDVLRYAPFDLGNALKYLIRAGYKDDEKQDLEKARVYIDWAMESFDLNGKLYDDFAERYGLLLKKFEVTKDIEGAFGGYTLICNLQSIICQRLARLK